ncbi:hypothetical protein VPHD530_0013 [Vibrio phage D530]
MNNYYTLCINYNGVWTPEFGDYHKATVVEERTESYWEIPRGCARIITTEDTQEDINKAVAKLNIK